MDILSKKKSTCRVIREGAFDDFTTKKFTHYVTREENGDLNLWSRKPEKYLFPKFRGWAPSMNETNLHNIRHRIDNRLYPNVKWEDDKPFKIMLNVIEYYDLIKPYLNEN